MTKKGLIAEVSEDTGHHRADVGKILDSIINKITNTDATVLKGFGTFEWKTSKARTGRNPATGETIEIPESTTLKFKASAGLRNL